MRNNFSNQRRDDSLSKKQERTGSYTKMHLNDKSPLNSKAPLH